MKIGASISRANRFALLRLVTMVFSSRTSLMRILLSLLLCCGCLALAAEKKPVTIEAASSMRALDTGSGAITWAPDGKTFVYEQQGIFMLYDMATQKARELTPSKVFSEMAVPQPKATAFDWENRRVSAHRVQWFPNGRQLLLSIGGDLFVWDLASAKATQLTKTAEVEYNPTLSPDGKSVAFRRDHDLYMADVATGDVRRLTSDGSATRYNGQLDWVYPEELDLGSAFWWSPDSQQVAYLQFDVSAEPMYPHADFLTAKAQAEPERYPQAGDANAQVRVGVLSLSTGKTRWMDTGNTKDALIARLNWTPDSRNVAVQKLNRVQDHLDLLLADIETGETKSLLKESDPAWINISDDLHFLKNSKEFLWTSERDGYRHIYLYGMDGKQKRQLTSGAWQASDIAGVDEEHRRVFYNSTEDSPLEHHLYSISLDGTGKKNLTSAAGSHQVSVSPDGSYFLDSYSSLTQPNRRTLNRADGSEVSVYKEADKKIQEEYELLPTEIVTFTDDQGNKFYARMIKPAGFQPGHKYPAVVFVYGGPHAQTVRNSWSGLSWEQALAQKGFVIWQMDGRGSFGRGHKWESALYRRFGKTELEDQQKGVRQLVSMGFVDAGKIGIYGWSYGGYMTLYSLLNAPDLFKAGIAGAPVTNWRNYDTIYTERYMGLPSENEKGYNDSSPVNQAANLKAQLMLVHNIEDDNVLFQNTLQMSNALQQAGKRFQLQLYPQKSHGVSGAKVRRQMLETMTAFFEETLK